MALEQNTPIPFEEIVTLADDIIVVTESTPLDPPGPRIVYVNNAFTDLTGYIPDEVIGRTPRILQGKDTDPQTKHRIKSALQSFEYVHERILNYSKAGKSYWLDIKIVPLANEYGEVTHYAAIERDVTKQVEKEQKLEQLVVKDPLTNIYNRKGFYEFSHKAISNAVRHNKKLSLAMIDIDHFKRVNDTYGHDAGDAALVFLAGKLKEAFRETDICARLGGEEFSVLLYDMGIDDAFEKMECVRDRIEKSIITGPDNTQVRITISAGIVEMDPENRNINLIIREADKQLYKAKSNGRNRVEVKTVNK